MKDSIHTAKLKKLVAIANKLGKTVHIKESYSNGQWTTQIRIEDSK